MSGTLTDEERAALYAAMREMEDEPDEDGNPSQEFHVPTSSKDVATLAGGTMVPTLAYIQKLEQIVTQHQKTIDRHERSFARLASAIRGNRSSLQQQSSRVNDISRDLDNKIERRHDF